MYRLLAGLLLLLSVQSKFHDIDWTGRADSSFSQEINELLEEKRVKRAVSYNGNLFESSEEYDEEDEKIMGSLFQQFLADSEHQLILDLDFFRHFFNYADAYKMGMQEGNIDLMKFAVKVVDRLKHFDISTACVADMFHLTWSAVEYATHVEEYKNCTDCKCTPLFQQKSNEGTWIFDVLDAMGKVPSGILGGNNLWVGSWNTCRKIHVTKNAQGQKWNGQYCLAHLSAYERDNPLKNLAKPSSIDGHCFANTSNTGRSESVDADKCFDLIPMLNFGVCAPDTCTDYDVTRMISFAIRLAEGALGKNAVCEVAVECRHEDGTNAMSNNNMAMAALYFFIFTIVMMVFGTLYDLLIFQREIEGLDDDSAKKRSDTAHPFLKVVMAYSVYGNGKWVLNTKKNEGEIDCLHGMRVLSMCWIILGHTYYYIGKSLTTDNLIPTLINFPQMFYTQIIVQAPLAVDSFFFLSGLLSPYLIFKRLFKVKSLKSVSNWTLWLAIFLKRFTRLTPTYAVIMLFDVTLFTYISSGPFWKPIEPQGCSISWWTNFLYLNNFLLQDKECCMGWTWYLANDMQLHIVVAPLLIMAFAKNKRWGYISSALMMVVSSVAKLWIILVNDYPPAPILTAKLQIVHKLDSYWNDVYVRPYVRCGPFIVGVILAFILNHYTLDTPKSIQIKLKKKTVLLGWTISTILGLYSVFGLFLYARTGDISEFWRVLYVLAGRPAYALAIGWVAFACSTGNGGPVNKFLSWKFFIPLSRITFCAYLLHPIMLQVYNLSRPQPFHFTTFFQMLRHAFEAIFVSYLLAFFFVLAFEKPFAAFDQMLLPLDRGKGVKKEEKKEVEPIEHSDEEESVPLKEMNGH